MPVAKDLYALVDPPAPAALIAARSVDVPADVAAAPEAAAKAPSQPPLPAGWRRFNRWIVRAYGALAPSARYK